MTRAAGCLCFGLASAAMATLLFLHGLAGHGAEWDPVIDELGTGHPWLAPDLRGHQGRAVDPHPLTADAFVSDALQWLRPGDVNIVIGQSMGGIIATLIASERPDLVHGLVMVEAGADKLSVETLESVTRWLGTWPDRFATSQEAAAFFGPDKATTPIWVAGLNPTPGGFEPRFEPEILIETMKVLAVPDRWDAWQRISIPTLIVRGAQGTLTEDHAKQMQIRHGKPEVVRIVEIPDAEHDVHLDQPARLAAAVSSFVDNV